MPRDFFKLESQAEIGQLFRHPVVTQEEVRRFRLALIGYFNAAGRRQTRQRPDIAQERWGGVERVAPTGSNRSRCTFSTVGEEGGQR